MTKELSCDSEYWGEIGFQEARRIIRGQAQKLGLTGYEDDDLLNDLYISLSQIDPQKIKNHKAYFSSAVRYKIWSLKKSFPPAASLSECEEKEGFWETKATQPIEKLIPPALKPSPEITEKLRLQAKILDDFYNSFGRLPQLKKKIARQRREIKNLRLKFNQAVKKLGGPEKAEALAQHYCYLLAKAGIDEPGLDVDLSVLRQALQEQGDSLELNEKEEEELSSMPAQLIRDYLNLPGLIRNRENNLKFLINLHSEGLAGWPCYVPEAFTNGKAPEVRLFFRKGQKLPNFACWTGSLPINPRKYLKLSPEILMARLLKEEKRRGKYADLNSIWLLVKKINGNKYYSKENLRKMIGRKLSSRQNKILEALKNLVFQK